MRVYPFHLLILSVFLAAGCGRGEGGADSRLPAGFGPIDPDVPVQSVQPTPPATPALYPKPCHPIYAEDVVPSYSLTIGPDDLAALRADHLDPTWRPAVFEYEGESWDVMVKNRGNSRCGQKLQLGISFNRVDREARFLGMRKIALDHGHCRVLDERLALAFVREKMGEPAACANHATLHVNGEFEGIYTNLEAINKDWLKRNFGPSADDGNLWKEGYLLSSNQETGTDDFLQQFKNAETLEELEGLADVRHAVRFWAIEAVIPASDNFYVDGWNYFLYEHPERGMVYIPRDYDKAAPWDERYVTFDPLAIASRPEPVPMVLGDSHWYDTFLRDLHEVLVEYDPEWFEERQDRWWEQILPFAVEDASLGLGPTSSPPSRIVRNIRARAEWLEENLPPAPEPEPAESEAE